MASIPLGDPTVHEEGSVCKLCLKENVKYTCPRCNIRYCSSKCYKCEAHASCSESFYRDCFMEGLQDMKTSTSEKQKVLDILQRLEQKEVADESDLESDDEPDLAERLEDIDLDSPADTEKLWAQLTSKEKKEFHCMIQDGRLGNLIELWKPWWLHKHHLVEEITSEEGADAEVQQYPQIIDSIPQIFTLMRSGKLSDSIQFNVVNVLFGYAYIMRLHNGDLFHVTQCANELRQISDSLQQGNHEDTACALHSVFESLHSTGRDSLFVSQQFSVAVLKDIVDILKGPGQNNSLVYIMAALSDIHRLFRGARKATDRDLKLETQVTKLKKKLQEDKRVFFTIQKKIEFLLSWTHKFGLSLHCLIPEVELEFCSHSTDLNIHREDQDRLEKAWGVGTFRMNTQEIVGNAIDAALKHGYTAFDTAECYRNQEQIGHTLRELLPKYNLKREDIFITSKLAPRNQGREACYKAYIQDCVALGVSHLDLFLIHWPGTAKIKGDDPRNAVLRRESWQALEQLYIQGKVKAIGVSNYTLKHLKELLSFCQIKPAVLQVEHHPHLVQEELVQYCHSHGIHFQAYSSLGSESCKELREDPTVQDIAEKYNKSSAQILLRWAVQQKIGVIPKSTNPDHIGANIAIFDFELQSDDMNCLNGLNRNTHYCWNPSAIT